MNKLVTITIIFAIISTITGQDTLNDQQSSDSVNEDQWPDMFHDSDISILANEGVSNQSDGMVRLLPITDQEDFSHESKIGVPVNFDEPLKPAKLIVEPYSICFQCACPKNTLDNPYRINCMALELKEIPNWHNVLDVPDSDLTNVHLEFDNNRIEIIPMIDNSNCVDSISFTYNMIHGIEPFAFAKLPNLKRLNLSNNALEIFHPSAFHMADMETFSPIEVLDLSYNSLTKLDSNVFEDLYNLVELNLRSNPIFSLNANTVLALNALVSLQYLNLAETELKELPMEMISPMIHLERLDLQDNSFTRIPEVLALGGELVELKLSGNPITELDASSFIELDKLQILEINNMPYLSTIYKGTFYPLKSLEILQINDNPNFKSIELGSVYDEYGNGPLHLRKVELRNNMLRNLNRDVFMYFHDDLVSLDVRDNPFNCTCELGWIKSEGVAFLYLENIRCFTPASLSGVSFAEIDFESSDVPCPSEEAIHHVTFHSIQLTSTQRYFFFVCALLLGILSIVTIVILLIHVKKSCYSGNKIYSRVTLTPRSRPSVPTINFGKSNSVKYMRQIDDEDEGNDNGDV